jgi:Tfp pilus assembly protein PilO
MSSKLLPIATILCALMVFFGYVNPEYSVKVKDLSKQVDGYNSALSAAEKFKSREDALIADRNNLPPEGLKRLETFLPDGVDNVQLILDLNALATRSGLRLASFEVATPESATGAAAPVAASFNLGGDSKPTDSITISLSAVGSYESLHTFMSAAENSLRPLDLEAFTLTNSETGVYGYTLVYRIYWLR